MTTLPSADSPRAPGRSIVYLFGLRGLRRTCGSVWSWYQSGLCIGVLATGCYAGTQAAETLDIPETMVEGSRANLSGAVASDVNAGNLGPIEASTNQAAMVEASADEALRRVGTKYYVDPVTGNDQASGKSPTTAWKTIAKVNGFGFAAGDQILFHRGGTWSDTLSPPTSGTSRNPLIFGAYGNGPKPVFDGQGVRSNLIVISSRSHVTVRDLVLQNTTGEMVVINGASTGVGLIGIDMSNAGDAAVAATGSPTGLTIDSCTYLVSPNFATLTAVVTIDAAVDSLTVSNNRFDLTGVNATNGHHPKNVYILDVNNAVVTGNLLIGGSQGIGVVAVTRDVTGVRVHQNSIYNVSPMSGGDGEAIEFTGLTAASSNTGDRQVTGDIYRNFVKGGGFPATEGGIDGFGASNCNVYDNIVVGPITNAAFHWTTNMRNDRFFNNTVYNASVSGFFVQDGTGHVVENNIIVNATMFSIFLLSGTADHNLYFHSGPVHGVAAGLHDMAADPLFVNPTPATAADVKLMTGSPAIDAGTSVGAPKMDFDGTPRPQGKAFDIGAYER